MSMLNSRLTILGRHSLPPVLYIVQCLLKDHRSVQHIDDELHWHILAIKVLRYDTINHH